MDCRHAGGQVDKEKHFVVTKVLEPEPPMRLVEFVELEAIHSRRSTVMPWRDLTDLHNVAAGLEVNDTGTCPATQPADQRRATQ